MPRKFFKRFLPEHKDLKERWYLRPFKALIQDPGLLHINRRSMCKGLAVGVFVCFIPLPGQTLIAALGAVWLRVNLPMAVAAVFISNPLTMAPLSFMAYKTGAWLLGMPHGAFHFEPTLDWLLYELSKVWAPFLFGSLVLAIVCSLLAYGISNFLWQWYVIHHYRRRKKAA
ncbi:MAG TPA: DUF2062 domain-containing protein [Gammaproteobacteria bacterium]|nr:DUF2062 domain-containing protein [Gammaproteobacteria bacterium]